MKSEKEKMLTGEPYSYDDAELLERWHVAKDLIRELSQVDSRDAAKIDRILSDLFGSRGEYISVTPPFHCDYGENIHIGNNTEINHGCVFLDCNRITIGSNVLIAPCVQLYAASHPLRAADRVVASSSDGEQKGMLFCVNQSAPITIGDNVWIGGGSIVLPGVTIGDNSVIGAGSVVTRDIPSGVLAVGNPCRVVRQIV